MQRLTYKCHGNKRRGADNVYLAKALPTKAGGTELFLVDGQSDHITGDDASNCYQFGNPGFE